MIRSRAALVALALVLIGCSQLAVDGRKLEGPTWRAVSVAGQAPIAGSEPTLIIDGGKVHGSAGCNGYTGPEPISISAGHVKLGQMLMTLGNCVGPDGQDLPVMVIERIFWTTISTVDRIDFHGEDLVLAGPSGELVFRASP